MPGTAWSDQGEDAQYADDRRRQDVAHGLTSVAVDPQEQPLGGSPSELAGLLRHDGDRGIDDVGQLEINRFLNSGYAFMGAASFVSSPGAWYWLRFRADGAALKARIWEDGVAEPATWTIESTDGALVSGSVYSTLTYPGISGLND